MVKSLTPLAIGCDGLLDRDLQRDRVAFVGAPRRDAALGLHFVEQLLAGLRQAHQRDVRLGEVGRVQADEAHAVVLDPRHDLLDQLVLDLAVLLVAPPHQHVAALSRSSLSP